MSAKTKIVVLHLKELIYTAIFAALGILFIILLFIMFGPDSSDHATETEPSNESGSGTETESESYSPGVYKSALSIDGNTVEITVTTAQDHIESITLGELDDTVSALYPLIESSFEDISAQLCSGTSLNEVAVPDDARYTSDLILDAISVSLDAARSAP